MTTSVQRKIFKLAIKKYGSQKQVAEELDTNQIQVSRYATCSRDMPLSIFIKLLKKIGGKIIIE